MGYDVDRFVGGVVDKELLCQICASVLQDAVETPCDHFFCAECIKNSLSSRKICPIDRQPLRKAQLRKPSRLLRNLLSKLEIKCDFEEHGCDMAVKLENLAKHLSMCNNNPDTEITCDKGCDLPVKRRDLASDCLVHLKNKMHSQDDKISHLSTTARNQHTQNKNLEAEISRKQNMVFTHVDEITRLTKLAAATPISKVRLLLDTDSNIFQIFENMKMHHNQCILEKEDKSGNAVAQLVNELEPPNPFSLCVLNSGPSMAMGFGGRWITGSPNLGTSLFYFNDGTVRFCKEIIHTGDAWKEGDHISCDLHFLVDGSTDSLGNSSKSNRIRRISFYKNFKKVFTVKSVEIVIYYPTVLIGSL